MARFCPLFSGSKGNCIAVGDADSFILIDAGRSARQISAALCERGLDTGRLQAIFVTHEHTDHISGLRVFASKLRVKVYGTRGTLDWLIRQGAVCGVDTRVCSPFGDEVGNMRVTAFRTMHDSAESCGYMVETADGRRITVATDSGCVTEGMRNALLGCDLAYIESNHDVHMLMAGSYPYPVKQRILSPTGHLSNETCAAELPYLAKNGTCRFVLGHISAENNSQEKARAAAASMLSALKLRDEVDYILRTTPPEGLPLMLL